MSDEFKFKCSKHNTVMLEGSICLDKFCAHRFLCSDCEKIHISDHMNLLNTKKLEGWIEDFRSRTVGILRRQLVDQFEKILALWLLFQKNLEELLKKSDFKQIIQLNEHEAQLSSDEQQKRKQDKINGFIIEAINFSEIKERLRQDCLKNFQNFKFQMENIKGKYKLKIGKIISVESYGDELLNQNKYDQALMIYQSLSNVNSSAELNQKIGDCLRLLKKPIEALKSYKTAKMIIKPHIPFNNQEAFGEYIEAFGEQENNEQNTEYLKIYKNILLGEAQTLHKQRKYKESLVRYSQILKRFPNQNDENFLVLLCKTLIKVKALKEAREFADRVSDDNKKQNLLQKIILQELDPAEDDIEQIKKQIQDNFDLNQNDYRKLYRIGICLLKLKRYEEAKNCFSQVLFIAPDYSKADYQLSYVKQKLSSELLEIHQDQHLRVFKCIRNSFTESLSKLFCCCKKEKEKKKQKYNSLSIYNNRNDELPMID